MNKTDWKSKTAGVLGMVVGLGALALKFLGTDTMATEAAITLAIGGFAVFGLGDNVQKVVDALKALQK